MVEPPLWKYESQLGWLFPIYGKHNVQITHPVAIMIMIMNIMIVTKKSNNETRETKSKQGFLPELYLACIDHRAGMKPPIVAAWYLISSVVSWSHINPGWINCGPVQFGGYPFTTANDLFFLWGYHPIHEPIRGFSQKSELTLHHQHMGVSMAMGDPQMAGL